MPITLETTQKFQEVVRRVYGQDLSLAQASQILHNLTSFYGLLRKIKGREHVDNNEQKDGN